MPYLEDLLQRSADEASRQLYTSAYSLGKPLGMAYSSFYPEWEVSTPQHQVPSPYSLAQMGYRTNELVFTCINVRADSVAEASIQIFDNRGKTPEEIKEHQIRELIENPCPGVSSQMFWKVTETYLGIAGFAAWEKQRNNYGEVVNLWPMRPDWCSFMRGQQKPIRAIRYQPHGLPPLDIAIEDILLFAYFDPLYPLLKPFSPTMSALEMVNTDNNMTLMIQNFIKNGAFLGGVLSTENQVLQEGEAEVYKRRWRDSHGGAEKAGEIAVLGKGLKFQTTNGTFRDMVFPDVDARSESRICMAFRVPPMLIGAKIGIDRSTYTNYPEARKGFYEGPITSEWKFLAGTVKDQLVSDFENDPKTYAVGFDTTDVKALQEDRSAKWTRATAAAEKNLITRDEAREEMGFDPIDNDPVFVGGTVETLEEQTEEEEPIERTLVPPMPQEPQPTQEELDLEEGEEKKYRSFAKRRIKEGKIADLREYEFKYLPEERQAKLIKEFEAQAVIASLREAASG